MADATEKPSRKFLPWPAPDRIGMKQMVLNAAQNVGPAVFANWPQKNEEFDMELELKIYRLVPTAPADDPQWMDRPPQGEVVVRALTTGDARLVASEAELDFTDTDAKPAEGNSTEMASAFRSEKLYTVIEDDSGRYVADGPRGVVDGSVRRDTIAPVESGRGL
jgi:hypothetical protein